MGPDVHFEGCANFLQTIKKHDATFAYVVDDRLVTQMKMFANGIRDLDVLKEKLGIDGSNK